MDSNKVLILAAVGLGAFFLMSRANAGAAYRVPGTTATGQNRYPTAPSVAAATEAAAYRDIGSLIGGIYRKIGGSQGAAPAIAPAALPDDSIAANPFGNIDPFSFEASAWGFDPSSFSFGG